MIAPVRQFRVKMDRRSSRCRLPGGSWRHQVVNIHGSCNYHTFSRQWLKSIFLIDFGLAGCKVGKAVVISIGQELAKVVRIQ
jgi:hypothetical protein